MRTLSEAYRPQSLEEIIGQDKAVKAVKVLGRRGLGGRAIWICGKSGTGKTTIARIVGREIADDYCVEEIDGSELTAEQVRTWKRKMSFKAIGRLGGHAFIVNEAHALRRDVITKLLVILEEIPDHVCWIFTTTTEGQKGLFEGQIDAHPLLSRCAEIKLTSQGLAKRFAARAKQIAEWENLDGKPIEAYVKLMETVKNNLRAALNEIEQGKMLT